MTILCRLYGNVAKQLYRGTYCVHHYHFCDGERMYVCCFCLGTRHPAKA